METKERDAVDDLVYRIRKHAESWWKLANLLERAHHRGGGFETPTITQALRCLRQEADHPSLKALTR